MISDIRKEGVLEQKESGLDWRYLEDEIRKRSSEWFNAEAVKKVIPKEEK